MTDSKSIKVECRSRMKIGPKEQEDRRKRQIRKQAGQKASKRYLSVEKDGNFLRKAKVKETLIIKSLKRLTVSHPRNEVSNCLLMVKKSNK